MELASEHSYAAGVSNCATGEPATNSKHRGEKSHKNCCVPHCNKYGYHSVEGHGKVSYFHFPADEELRKKWIDRIWKDKDTKFEVKNHTYICSLHFQTSDYECSKFSGRRFLYPGAVPTVFNCWTDLGQQEQEVICNPQKENAWQLNRTVAETISSASATATCTSTCESDSEMDLDVMHEDVHVFEQNSENEERNILVDDGNSIVKGLAEKDLQCRILGEKVRSLTGELESVKAELKFCEFSIDNIRPSDMVFFTGFPSIDVFNDVIDFLNPGENGENIVLSSQACQDGQLAPCQISSSKRGRPRKLSPRNQFFLFLCRVRLGLFELDLSYRFRISLSTVSLIIITWANFIYLRLGNLNIWATKEQVVNSMPETFQEKYPSTRVIVDASEIKLEMASSLILKSQSYSNYKSCNTLKGLIGITPAGNLSFVSQLYTGSISDRELIIRSGILKLPFERGDSLMADKGFDIQDLLDPIGVSLNIPPFLGHHAQMSAADVASTQSIAAERIHVERLINKVKNFHIFDQVIPLSLAGSINQIWTSCALLTLFQNPIISCPGSVTDVE